VQKTRDETLLHFVRKHARSTPNSIFLVDTEGRSATYAEALEATMRWAGAYRSIGVGAGDCVVTTQESTLLAAIGWLGLASLGAIEVPVANTASADDICHALSLSGARTVLAGPDQLAQVVVAAKACPDLRRIVVLGDAPAPASAANATVTRIDALLADAEPRDLPLPEPWQLMGIVLTSGTTGRSKLVRVPWGQLNAIAHGTFPLDDFSPDEVTYTANPAYHGATKILPYLAAIVGGRCVVRGQGGLAHLASDLLEYGVTTATHVPFAWLDGPVRADDADRRLRNVLALAATPDLLRFLERFDCRAHIIWNQTETSCPIGMDRWNGFVYDEQGRTSCGRARSGYPGAEVAIVDRHDQPLEPGQVGELVIRQGAPWTMNDGYLGDPAATTAAWRNGWFHSGDAFVRNAEGYYFYIDRISDCLIRAEVTVASGDIERRVIQHPEVRACAAVQVRANGPVVVFYTVVDGKSLPEAALLAWLRTEASERFVPDAVQLMDALPMTPTGKVQKARLRQRLG
jgi:crotonobetaine/carnitine-CoA ligase